MIIFSDNHETVLNFSENELIELPNTIELPSALNTITKKIFQERKYRSYEHKLSDYWDYLFLTKHAVESQYDIVNNLLSKNVELPDRLLLIAEKGDGFHGFRSRAWSAEEGNIHLTVYFQPQKNYEHFHTGLLIVAAVSVLQTIDLIPDLTGKAKTKWVNDIIIDNSKVCGIITQSFSIGNKISGAVIGIGLNVLTEPKFDRDVFTQSASSLINRSKSGKCNIKFVFNKLLINLERNIELLNSGKYDSLLKIYCERSGVIGKNVNIYTDSMDGTIKPIIAGKVLDINKNLELIIENYSPSVKNGRLAIID